jgi:adenylate kinase family enzyme
VSWLEHPVVSFLRQLGRDPTRPLPRLLIVISGPVKAGKSELARRLSTRLQADVLSTGAILRDEYGAADRPAGVALRLSLQALGEQLDRETGGAWVLAAVDRRATRLRATQPIIVDAVRVPEQLALLRNDSRFRVVHVHLSADVATLRTRYDAAAAIAPDGDDWPPYDDVRANETEARIGRMRERTRLRLNTRWLGRRVVAGLARTAIAGRRGRTGARSVAGLILLGAPGAAVILIPVFWWSLSTSRDDRLADAFLGLLVVLLIFFAALLAGALNRFSPVERDKAPPPSG